MEQGWMGTGVPLNEEEKRRLVLRLVARLRCVECGRPYDREDLALVHRWQDVWVLSTRCRHCDQVCHVVVFMRLDAEPEPVGDLTPEEITEAEAWPLITADDVLDVHELLREFDGDIDALLTG